MYAIEIEITLQGLWTIAIYVHIKVILVVWQSGPVITPWERSLINQIDIDMTGQFKQVAPCGTL